MVNLTRIYTRTGDDGTTALGDFTRTDKNDARLVAYADVDEANACVGLVLVAAGLDADVSQTLLRIQNDLFDVGADLCTPPAETGTQLRITQEYVTWLESQIDMYNAGLEPLRSFVLPGGTEVAARLHQARTVVRRAERATWAASQGFPGQVSPLAAQYLNRLSDLLFVLSRYANREAGDLLWQPGRRQQDEPA